MGRPLPERSRAPWQSPDRVLAVPLEQRLLIQQLQGRLLLEGLFLERLCLEQLVLERLLLILIRSGPCF